MEEIKLAVTLKKCPLCGQPGRIVRKFNYLKVTTSASHARNVQKIKTCYNPSGKRVYDVYCQTKYQVRCSSDRCLLKSIDKYFWSSEEAAAAWNKRIVIEDK